MANFGDTLYVTHSQAPAYNDAKVEASFESVDRTWRRWRGFCKQLGINHHQAVYHMPTDERELVLRSFLTVIRFGSWSPTGDITGTRSRPVGGKVVRSSASNLAEAFRRRFEWSPIHIANSNILRPTIRDLLKAFDNVDPPPNRQKAITPSFLRRLFKFCYKQRQRRSIFRHSADLIIGSYFFACRSCEYVLTPTPGVTIRLKIRHLQFRDASHRIVDYDDPNLPWRAAFVTICFENQKNRAQREKRSHSRTSDPILCPVRRFTTAVRRILDTIPHADPNTDLCTACDDSLRPLSIDNTFTLQLLRTVCRTHGGKSTFGFDPSDIGNKSIRSGAAMALFMSKQSPFHIMMMGRWKSTAFMAYIRPQVLEWTHQLSESMIQIDHFLDLHTPPTDLDSTLRPHLHHNGRPIQIETFNVSFDWNQSQS